MVPCSNNNKQNGGFDNHCTGAIQAEEDQERSIEETDADATQIAQQLHRFLNENRALHATLIDGEGRLSAKGNQREEMTRTKEAFIGYRAELKSQLKDTVDTMFKLREESMNAGVKVLQGHAADTSQLNARFQQFWSPEAVRNATATKDTKCHQAIKENRCLKLNMDIANASLQRMKPQDDFAENICALTIQEKDRDKEFEEPAETLKRELDALEAEAQELRKSVLSWGSIWKL